MCTVWLYSIQWFIKFYVSLFLAFFKVVISFGVQKKVKVIYVSWK